MGKYQFKLRGSWYFNNYDKNKHPTQKEILDSLTIILTELIDSKMLIPKKLWWDGDELVYNTVDELIELLIQKEVFKENMYAEFDLNGDTVIYSDSGEEIYSDIVRLGSFRLHEHVFSIETFSDIWLPMFVNEEDDYEWNLERYRLNYYRIPKLLNRLNERLGWDPGLYIESDYYKGGTITVGCSMFISEGIILFEVEDQPNKDFDVEAYLSEIKKVSM